MRRLIPALGLFVVGCATSSPDPSAGTPPRAMAPPVDAPEVWALGERFAEGTISKVQPDVDRVGVTIQAPPDPVWEALIQVWEGLGIEIAGADPRIRALNNPNFAVSRRLGGERLSRYLICGADMSGGYADRFRIQMNIYSQVIPGSEGESVLETTIQAFGDNPEGVSNSRVPCSSTHELEYRIAGAVGELVGGAEHRAP